MTRPQVSMPPPDPRDRAGDRVGGAWDLSERPVLTRRAGFRNVLIKEGVPPEPGQLVQVRNRPGIVTATIPHTGPGGALTLATVEYLDGHLHPSSDQVLWELEASASPLANAGWPAMHRQPPDHPDVYSAYLHSIRWTSLQSVLGILGTESRLPLVSPWSASAQIEDYQLTPVIRALSMPRVALLLADDVGLGKTIQAGLVATELIVRRRIKRILVVCPASLQDQWRDEMSEKFHLDFKVMDADEVHRIACEIGSDVNPWSIHNRVITSMDYLRQEVVYQSFEASAKVRQTELGGAFAPWDLLIVDEAHNVAPKSLTDDSLRTRMMRRLTMWFEHRLFLTATPHNGYTESFTGLLQLLDPFRFVQKTELTESDRRHVNTVMIRRLKRDVNSASPVPRFADREVKGVRLVLGAEEKRLYDALRQYRLEARQGLQVAGRKNELRGRFVVTLMTKRLLSSPFAFARTWWRHVGGELAIAEDRLDRTLSLADEEITDDVEKDSRERVAVAEAGAWLLKSVPKLRPAADAVSDALRAYGWTEQAVAAGPQAGLDFPDAKADALIEHIQAGHPAVRESVR